MKDKIFLIEDHDQALKVWRKEGIKRLDLVHIDAHLDFGFFQARPVEQVIKEARSLSELKLGLEQSIVFNRYEKNFEKQLNIGNYIYQAIQEGVVRDFYWVVPVGIKEFKGAEKIINSILKRYAGKKNSKFPTAKIGGSAKKCGGKIQNPKLKNSGIISTKILRRKFTICILEKLPKLKHPLLLDIDTDFLIEDSFLNASNMAKIGKQEPWISAKKLVEILKKKIRQPKVITIAYSVNGGFTPMRYKHIGDEIAYHFAPERFSRHYKNSSQAAQYFSFFEDTGKKTYYQKAVKLNPTYRAQDNNYGPLYLALRKFSLARKEFSRVLKADPKNPGCLLGLGSLSLQKKEFRQARKYFSYAFQAKNNGLFSQVKEESLFGLAKAEFHLKNFRKAKELLLRYHRCHPLQPQTYYLLGRIFEQEKDYARCAQLYQDALRLGLGSTEALFRLLKISVYLKEKESIIKYVTVKYNGLKSWLKRAKVTNPKRYKKDKNLQNLAKKTMPLEKKLKEFQVKGGEEDAGFISVAQEQKYGHPGN